MGMYKNKFWFYKVIFLNGNIKKIIFGLIKYITSHKYIKNIFIFYNFIL